MNFIQFLKEVSKHIYTQSGEWRMFSPLAALKKLKAIATNEKFEDLAVVRTFYQAIEEMRDGLSSTTRGKYMCAAMEAIVTEVMEHGIAADYQAIYDQIQWDVPVDAAAVSVKLLRSRSGEEFDFFQALLRNNADEALRCLGKFSSDLAGPASAGEAVSGPAPVAVVGNPISDDELNRRLMITAGAVDRFTLDLSDGEWQFTPEQIKRIASFIKNERSVARLRLDFANCIMGDNELVEILRAVSKRCMDNPTKQVHLCLVGDHITIGQSSMTVLTLMVMQYNNLTNLELEECKIVDKEFDRLVYTVVFRTYNDLFPMEIHMPQSSECGAEKIKALMARVPDNIRSKVYDAFDGTYNESGRGMGLFASGANSRPDTDIIELFAKHPDACCTGCCTGQHIAFNGRGWKPEEDKPIRLMVSEAPAVSRGMSL